MIPLPRLPLITFESRNDVVEPIPMVLSSAPGWIETPSPRLGSSVMPLPQRPMKLPVSVVFEAAIVTPAPAASTSDSARMPLPAAPLASVRPAVF